MKKAFQRNAQLIADIAKSHHLETGFRIWWLGQSGFLIQYKGKYLLFDPYLSDSLTKKYKTTDKPHTRVSELCVRPELLTMVDVVTSSHNHTDHLDAETLLPLFDVNKNLQFVIPEANRAFVCERLGCAIDMPIGMNDGESVTVGGFTLHGLPAAHNNIERDDEGRCKFMGFVASFGDYCVYHSGDTLWFDELPDLLKSFDLTLALLPINGNKPERKVAGNLNYEEAARLGKVIGAKCVIPHHYDLFEFNTENPALFEAKAKEYGTPFRILKIGEGLGLVE
jgi:L-ascorbate metabolism protein UlaG (beta-lactamase superfamily)